ncbi:MAG: NADH dehydrogenase [Bdellovibrionales bacterium RIFOXYD1_FULL_44_7]|nr:MAG: NADH dehydrogenase [Bdellovibrionales bacterium RIFOXYD1_FULL_44_7]
MDWFNTHLLTSLVFFPLLWAAVGLLIPSSDKTGKSFLRYWYLFGSLVTLAVSFLLYFRFDGAIGDYQFVESVSWIPAFGVIFSLGADGISLWLIILTTLLTVLAVAGSFTAIRNSEKQYYFLLLALETAMLGAFCALDVFLFYLFWEAMLIPMYFLIGIWGGPRRIYASIKFFIYTAVGSLLMLVAIFYLAHQHKVQFGVYSTAFLDFYRLQIPFAGFVSAQSILFLAFAFAFSIKVPLFPLHTWLPDAHVEAPTAGSVILAGVLLKMGGYGFIRLAFPLFPDAVQYYQVSFMALGAVAIVYGAFVAFAQKDVKKLVAYSSVSHMGYVVLGLFSLNALATTGSIYQMLSHGVSTGALFILVGMIYERRHTREISEFGGIAKTMPLFALAFMIIVLSSIGVPGTNGFVGEFLVLLGAWNSYPVFAVVAAVGVILGAVYMLWMFQKVMLGPITNEANKVLKDITIREKLVLIPLLVLVFWMGVFPGFFISKMEPSINTYLSRVKTVQGK